MWCFLVRETVKVSELSLSPCWHLRLTIQFEDETIGHRRGALPEREIELAPNEQPLAEQ
jgi:hypothetical protein